MKNRLMIFWKDFNVRAIFFLFLFALLFSTSAHSQQQPETEIRTVIVDNYFPYTFVNKEGQPDGFSVELIKAVAKELGMNIKIGVESWSKSLDMILSDEINALSIMAHSIERGRKFDFSAPYTISYDAYFTRKGDPQIFDSKELQGKKIIINKLDQAHDYLKGMPFLSENQFLYEGNTKKAMGLLSSGKGDVAVMPKVLGIVLLRELQIDNVDMNPPIINDYERPFCFAVKEGNLNLLHRLENGLQIVIESGRFKEIHDKWLGPYEHHKITFKDVFKYFLWIILVFVVISGLLILWTATLRRQVSHRTTELEQEIDNRKLAEEALQTERDLLQTVIDAPRNMHLVYLDNEFNFVRVNEAYAATCGYRPAEMVGKNHFALYPDPENEAIFTRVRDTGEPFEVHDKAFQFPDQPGRGVTYWDWTLTPEKDPTGRVAGLIFALVETTERKQAELALRKSEEKHRKLTENLPQRIFQKDTNCVYVSCNGNFAEDLGTSASEIEGKTDFDFFPKKLAEKYQADDLRIMETGKIEELEEGYITDGQKLTVQTVKVPLTDDYGNTNGILGIFWDITDRKLAEEEREKLQAQLNQAQKMEAVGRLAGGVAHDFNNMLSVILGHIEMTMEEVPPDNPHYANLQEIKKAAQHSADITRQLLAFARKQTIAPRVMNLNKTLKSMLKMIRRLIGEDINLVWLPGKALWSVRMDPSQIDQILANLCLNARDAIAGVGKITIETGRTTFDQAYCADHPGFIPGDFVVLAVSDDGYGMDKETLNNLFEPFFTTKDVDRGTGLGLATVYGIVKQNNGFINVYSEPGQGTTFKIYLPRHRVKTDALPEKVKRRPTEHGHETILLVEDEPSILKMTTQMLERLGYTILAAVTPEEAIRLAREHGSDIHLLMTDVIMPEMNGRDLASNLLSTYPNLKRLFMSGYTANVIAHHGVLDDDVNFIQKPFSKHDLAIKVREVLDEDKG